MASQSEREYASQADYAEWVRQAMASRWMDVISSLRRAFSDVIRREEVEVVLFSELTAAQIADRLIAYPLVLKPLLLASNIAARAIERDLGIKNVDTYKPRLSQEHALSIAAYIKPFLPTSLSLPTLAEIDRLMFVDKEVRKIKGQWERMVMDALRKHSNVAFKKCKFQHNGQSFEIDAASRDSSGSITCGLDIKRIEARRDVHKRTDEIANKASCLKGAYPHAYFGAIVYYPFTTEHGNVRDRLQSPYVDSVVFAGAAEESVESAVKLLLGKLRCLRS